MKIRCASCRKSFEARRRTAKFCSPACQKRARRAAAKQAPAKKPPVKKTVAKRAPAKKATTRSSTPALDRHGLVVAVRRELEDAGKVDTVQGQIALQLARRLANPDASGPTALADKLIAATAAAIGGPKPDGDGSEAPAEPDDEVTRARKAREQAQASQAAGRT